MAEAVRNSLTAIQMRRRWSLSTAVTVLAAALTVAFLAGMGCAWLRQVQLDRALVNAAGSRDAPLARVQTLLRQGANPNARELIPFWEYRAGWTWRNASDWLRRPERRNGCTPLIAAACTGRADIVRELLERGADVHIRSGEMYGRISALHAWAQVDAPNGADIVRLLLEHGADPNERLHPGMTLLMLAVEHRDTAAVRMLLSHGADPSAADKSHWTPLRYGIGSGNIQPATVQALLEYGADVNSKGSDGITPLTRARQAHSSDAVINLLRRAGAKD